MEKTVNDITTKTRQSKKPMKYTDKEEVGGSFNFKTPKHNIMHTPFYSDISEFFGNLQGMLN